MAVCPRDWELAFIEFIQARYVCGEVCNVNRTLPKGQVTE